MPMWARAIIFGIELVGFILSSIFVTKKSYKEGKQDNLTNKEIKGDLKFNIIFCSVIFAIILALFLLTFPSYVFFSYNKLLLVSVVELVFISLIMWVLTYKRKISYIFMYLFALFSILTIALLPTMAIGALRIDDKVAVSEPSVEKEIIIPTMFSENQIGNVYDAEGNLKKHIFYYKDEDGWHYKELDSDTNKLISKNEKTYIERTTKRTICCNKEKKPTEEDYSYIEEKEEYVIYQHQFVDIMAD